MEEIGPDKPVGGNVVLRSVARVPISSNRVSG